MAEPTEVALGIEQRPFELILAAGGMVVRPSGAEVEIALVHRPIREDWSFPKGKAEPGESLTECALREVLEETGLRCRIASFIGTTEYRDRKDRPKVVAYWAMVSEGGTFRSSPEVDEMRWVGLDEAQALLSYERDRDLLVNLGEATSWIFPGLRPSA